MTTNRFELKNKVTESIDSLVKDAIAKHKGIFISCPDAYADNYAYRILHNKDGYVLRIMRYQHDVIQLRFYFPYSLVPEWTEKDYYIDNTQELYEVVNNILAEYIRKKENNNGNIHSSTKG